MKRLLLGALMVAAIAFAPQTASAAIVIDFGTGLASAGGTYTLLPNGNATGSNIPVGVLVTDLNGALGSFCTSGTGGSNGLCGPTSAVLNFSTVTNSIQIIGGIPSLGIANGTVLLSGSFVSWTADANGLHNAIGPDTKGRELLTALGLPITTQFAFFGFSLTSSFNSQTGTWNIISTDIRNTAVPEPGSLMLLGTGLLGAAAFARRRLRKA